MTLLPQVGYRTYRGRVLDCLEVGQVLVLLTGLGACSVMYDMLDIAYCGCSSHTCEDYISYVLISVGMKRTGIDVGGWGLKLG